MKQQLVERQKSKVERQEKPERFNKSKLDWVYARVIEDKYIDPADVVVLHSPLEPSLIYIGNDKRPVLHLRTCLDGLDKSGNAMHHLYCTENHNRFFDLQKDGWHEQKPSYRPDRPSKNRGGHANYMDMINFGEKSCHLLIAHAWVESRYNYMTEVLDEKTGTTVLRCTMQIDHKDTNTLNNNADNLEYVTPAENMRRKRITDRLKNKHGIDPKRLTPLLMHGIFSLPEGRLEELIGRFLFVSKDLEAPMDVTSIRLCVATALDWMKASAANINC